MPFPGDNGDWTNFNNFLERLASDIKINNMQDGIVYDLWNEPDLNGFWMRSQQQYIDTWGRAYGFLRYVIAPVAPSLIDVSSPIRLIA